MRFLLTDINKNSKTEGQTNHYTKYLSFQFYSKTIILLTSK